MKKLGLILITSLTLLTSGCFLKEKDLNRMLFPLSLGITYEDNLYKIYLQILNTSTISIVETVTNQNNSDFILIHSESENISQALSDLSLKASTIVSAIKLKNIVLHKSVFDDGPIDYYQLCQYFINNPIFRTKVQLFITNTKIEDFYNTKYLLVGSAIYDHENDEEPELIKSHNKASFLLDSLKSYSDLNRMYHFPIIDIVEDKVEQDSIDGKLEKTKAYFYNGACFFTYSDKMIECLAKEDTDGFKWYSEIPYVDIEIKNHNTPINVIVESSTWNTKIKDDTFNINIKLNAYINFNLSTISISKIKETLNELVKDEILNTLNLSYEKSIDIYHLNDYALRHHKILKYNLNNVVINVESTIKNTTYYKY